MTGDKVYSQGRGFGKLCREQVYSIANKKFIEKLYLLACFQTALCWTLSALWKTPFGRCILEEGSIQACLANFLSYIQSFQSSFVNFNQPMVLYCFWCIHLRENHLESFLGWQLLVQHLLSLPITKLHFIYAWPKIWKDCKINFHKNHVFQNTWQKLP